MPFMNPGFIDPRALPALLPRGVAPGMEIMPYTGPGSEIVPKPTRVPSPGIPQGPGRGRPPRAQLPVGRPFGGGPQLPALENQPKVQSNKQQVGARTTSLSNNAAKAAGAGTLARFIGPAFLGLMGIDLLSRAGQSRRQKEMMLQQMGMMGLTGGAQFGDQLGALAMGQNYSNVVGGMGALAEGMQIPSASELELSLLLGKSGAAAAQKAAVAPQMDEIALEYVLGMT
jgi:hypothetical protein